MAFRALQVTIPTPAAATQVSSALPAAERAAGVSLPCQMISFQALKAVAADIFIGDTSAVSSTAHAIRVDPADTAPPIVLAGTDSGSIKLGDFWITGTAGDVLLVGYVTY